MQALAKYNTVFSQLLPFFQINQLDKCSKLEKGDKWVKKFFNKYLFVTMVYGLLARQWSLRLLENSLNPQTILRRKIGLPEVHRATISKALETRSAEIFGKHFSYLSDYYEDKCFKARRSGKGLTLIDATAIKLPPHLCDWADYKREAKEIKLHIIIDSVAEIPQFCRLTLGAEAEITVARNLVEQIPADRIVVFDNGYFAFDLLSKLVKRGIKFIVPLKQKTAYQVKRQTHLEQLPDDIVSDQIIAFNSHLAKKYNLVLRLIVYRNPATGELFTYLTNCFEQDSELMVEIYRQRWKIEIFFRWIKQNLKITSFWGTSRNAIEIQVWVALIVFLVVRAMALMSRIGKSRSPYYFFHFLRNKLFERTDIYLFLKLIIS